MKITKDTIIGDIVELGDEAVEVLLSIGMHCMGCPAAKSETIGEACEVHDADIDEVLKQLNGCVSSKI